MRPLIPYFIQEQFEEGNFQGQLEAFTLFVDLSGFTSLTERLMQAGNEGAEQLSMTVNNIFTPIVKMVYERGGFIPYYAGDAFTAIFPLKNNIVSIDVLLKTALEIQTYFEQEGLQKTLFGSFQIGVKIGLSVGKVDWGIVGNHHNSFYFKGEAIQQCAACQMAAKDLQIIFDLSFKQKLNNKKVKARKLRNQDFYLLQGLKQDHPIALPTASPSNRQLHRKTVERFIPKPILNFNQAGEFRPVIAVFLAFSKIDAHPQLDAFTSIILEQIQTFSGYFKEIDFGDKGNVIVAFFGAPVSFENNIERSLEFIAAVEEESYTLRKEHTIQFKAGITDGTAFTGILGGEERVQYAVVGNRVNLAARLMTYSDWGEILVDESIQKNRQFRFQKKGDIHYKGIQGLIPTYKLIGRNATDSNVFSGKMVGRENELKELTQFARPLWENRSAGIIYIYGEAGIGKSRLTYEFMQVLNEQSSSNTINPVAIRWANCQADQILRKPFNPFIYFLKNYFQQSSENSKLANVDAFEKSFRQLIQHTAQIQHQEANSIIEELKRTKSILAALIALPTTKESLWEQLDAKGRYQNTLQAISNLLIAISIAQPLVIELEDAHWFDDSSKVFLQDFLRLTQQYPILLLITSRYFDDGSKPKLIPEEDIEKFNISQLELDLNILPAEGIRAFAEHQLEGKISKEFHKLLIRTTNGNPFYAEQIIEYFVESDLLKQKKAIWHIKDKNVKLSNSINAILMARVDRLSNLVKETVKAAAVIGREFEVPVLSEVMKVQEAFIQKNGNHTTVLQEQIKTAEQGQIWRAMNELRYIFKHSLLREAVYDMQLRVRLRELHRQIAEAIEHIYKDDISERYFDLSFHYEQAESWKKAIFYTRKAADYARRNFQNQQAIRFYDKLLNLPESALSKENRIRLSLKKGSVLELVGDWENCETTYTIALEQAMFSHDDLLEARANDALGKLLMLKGNYKDARHHLETAVQTFENIDDKLGIAKTYGNLGNLYFRQGRYDEAKEYFSKSIALSRSLEYNTATAQIVSNLGLTHMNQGNYEEGIFCQAEQLSISITKGDKQSMATLYTNMGIVYFEKGDYKSALSSYEKGLALSRELGNKLLTSIAIGCIGSVYQQQGNFEKAMDNFQLDMELCLEMGDKQGISIAHGLLGDLYAIKGDFDDAINHLGQQLDLCEGLNYQKGIAKATNTLGNVYFYLNDYAKSIEFYDRSIEVSQAIKNQALLQSCFLEKIRVLIHQKEFLKAKELLQELEKQLPLDHFQLCFLKIQWALAQNDKPTATSLYKTLQAITEEEKVDYLYLASLFNASEKQKAFQAYQKLYQQTPKYNYKKRIEELK